MSSRRPSYDTNGSPVVRGSPDHAFAKRRGFLAVPYQQRLELPPEVVESFYALPSPDEIEVSLPGQRVRVGGGDYLFLWKADKYHQHDTWFVRMRPARDGIKERWSTGCRFEELDQAKAKYLSCLSNLRSRHLNRVSPKQRLITDVLSEFFKRQSSRHHDLEVVGPGRLVWTEYSIKRLLPFIDGKKVGDMSESTSGDWMAWAKAPKPEGGGYSHNTAFGDIYLLRGALETVLNTEDTFYRAPFEMPAEAPTSNEAFTPDEMDRVPEAAATGWIWDAVANDWKRDASGACVLRRKEVARAAEPYGRMFVLGSRFGSRGEVTISLTWTNSGGPWIDLDRRILHRLGAEKEKKAKRKGFCTIPEELVRILSEWRDEDLAHGCDHVIHTWDYKPIREVCYQVWYGLLEAAGARPLNPHCLKHTCVWILKLEEVPLGAAADFLFTWPHTLVKRYGPDWDALATARAAEAVGSMRLFRARYADEAARQALVAAVGEAPPAPANDDAAPEEAMTA